MRLSNLQKCAGCGEGLMHDNKMFWYRVSVVQEIADLAAMQRAHGMEMVMGGHVALARIMSPDEHISHDLGKPVEFYVCFDCYCGNRRNADTHLSSLHENASKAKESSNWANRASTPPALTSGRFTADYDDDDENDPDDEYHCETQGCDQKVPDEHDLLCERCVDRGLGFGVRCVDPDCTAVPHARGDESCVDFDPNSGRSQTWQIQQFAERAKEASNG